MPNERITFDSGAMYIENRYGPSADPWGTPASTGDVFDDALL